MPLCPLIVLLQANRGIMGLPNAKVYSDMLETLILGRQAKEESLPVVTVTSVTTQDKAVMFC